MRKLKGADPFIKPSSIGLIKIKQTPRPKRRANGRVAVRWTTGCRRHDFLHLAPLLPKRCPGIQSPWDRYSILKSLNVHF
jgi:hypothetical protein